MRGRFGPDLFRIDGVASAMDDVIVDAVLDVGRRIRRVVEPLAVSVVLGEQQLRRAFARQPAAAQRVVFEFDRLADSM